MTGELLIFHLFEGSEMGDTYHYFANQWINQNIFNQR